jgi:uncharacterized SAM-binding protein YcdF (DUF218 family)
MRRLAPWIAGLLLLALVLAYEPVLQALGGFLAVSDALQPADAIIAISGDGPERVRTAGLLLKQGYGRWLILSGAPAGWPGSAAELARYARRVSVPEDRVLLDETAMSTFDNAVGSARVMRSRGLASAILVTSPYHMRRAIVEFRTAFRTQGLTVRAFAARDSFFEVERWWTRGRDRGLVVREYVKLLAFLVGLH